MHALFLLPSRGASIMFRPAAISLGLALLFAGVEAQGATFTVTNTNDSGAGSLRDAVGQANSASGSNIITFGAGVTGTITLTSGSLQLQNNNNLTITGPGASLLTVSGNNASRVFDLLAGTTFNVSGLTISSGRTDFGAGISNNSGNTLTVSNCVFSGNVATSNGGAINNNTGGAVVSGSTFTGNSAGFGGGGLYLAPGTASVTNCVFSTNSATAEGGGLRGNGSLTVSDSTFSGNSCSSGAGFYNSGTLTMNRSTVANNTASNRGGGFVNTGTVTLTNCTISGNTGAGSGYGGGFVNFSTATASNCTLSGNSSPSGGAIDNRSNLTLRNNTFAGNSTNTTGSDLINSGPLTIGNNIFNDTQGGSINNPNGATVTDEGFNLAHDNGGGVLLAATDKLNTDAVLGALANNGGPTQTHALLVNSPAIDAGNSSLTSDQRGNPRPVDVSSVANGAGSNGSDIGAFEFDPAQTGSPLLVNTLADHDDGTCGQADCTLREAIRLTGDAGTINFSPTLAGTITLAGSDLYIDKSLTIPGPGAKQLAISGNNLSRIFHLSVPQFGTVDISGLTITRGRIDNGAGIYAEGAGALNLSRCTLSNNNAISTGTVTGSGGGLYNSGAITLTVDSCTFANNGGSGSGGGGALYQGGNKAGTVKNSTFSGNNAYYGGAVLNFNSNGGSLALQSCTFSGNGGTSAGGFGSSVRNGFYTLRLQNNIFNDTAGGSIDNSTGGTVIDDGHNLARDNGGGALGAPADQLNKDPMLGPLQDNGGPTQTHALLSTSPAIDKGDTPLATDQRGVARPFGQADDIGAFEFASDPTDARAFIVTTTEDTSYADGLVSLREAIASANSDPTHSSTITFAATAFGAPRKTITLNGTPLPAIGTNNSLTITGPTAGVVIDGNNASRVFQVTSFATVTMTGLTIAHGGNIDRGGGILNTGKLTVDMCTLSSNHADNGGGIFNDPAATLTLRNSTLNSNGTSSAFGKGGAIDNAGVLRVENSSFGSNTSFFAAALYNDPSQGRSVLLDSVTIASNQATDCGGIINDSSTAVALVNTLIANNTNTNGDTNRANVAGSFNGFSNLISNGDGSGGLTNGVNNNQIGSGAASINALLGSLANNGGPTQTFALLPGSPAIDAGDTDLTVDQRAVPRPQRSSDDIGAFERQNSAPTAGPDSIQRYANQSASVPEATLLANDTDPEGDTPLSIVSVSPAASGQATVSRANGYVFYDPSAGFNVSDSFTYQVQDSRGATSTGIVTVNIATGNAPANSTLIVREPASGGGTQARLTFTALPGRTYHVQYTNSLASPITWNTFPGSVTANAQGQFQIIDPPPLPSQRFYRAIYP